jgi:hypothetical protein
MALSVLQNRVGPLWPLGYINVANSGTPSANLASLIDANGNGAPNFAPSPGNAGPEYTPRFKSLWLYGFHPGANNNGMVPNNGNVYVLMPAPANGGGPGNRSDSGCMVGILQPGQTFPIPQSLASTGMQVSPYSYTLDADVNGDGALVVGVQPQGN